MTSNAFPLLKLSQKQIHKVLGYLEPLEQIMLSFCSKRCLQHVQSFNLWVKSITLFIEDSFVVSLRFANVEHINLRFHTLSLGEPGEKKNLKEDLHHVQLILGSYHEMGRKLEDIANGDLEEEMSTWKKEDYKLRDYIDHILSIFKSYFTLNLNVRLEEFSSDSIKETFRGLSFSQISTDWVYTREYWISLMRDIQPVHYFNLPLLELQEPEDNMYLIGNLDVLDISEHLTLDQFLLTTNSKEISNFGSISNKSLNRFLKLWMKGGYSRLRYIHIYNYNENFNLNPTEVMKGIHYEEMNPNEERIFQKRSNTMRVKNGLDIRGKGGVKATVVMRVEGRISRFFLFVWP